MRPKDPIRALAVALGVLRVMHASGREPGLFGKDYKTIAINYARDARGRNRNDLSRLLSLDPTVQAEGRALDWLAALGEGDRTPCADIVEDLIARHRIENGLAGTFVMRNLASDDFWLLDIDMRRDVATIAYCHLRYFGLHDLAAVFERYALSRGLIHDGTTDRMDPRAGWMMLGGAIVVVLMLLWVGL